MCSGARRRLDFTAVRCQSCPPPEVSHAQSIGRIIQRSCNSDKALRVRQSFFGNAPECIWKRPAGSYAPDRRPACPRPPAGRCRSELVAVVTTTATGRLTHIVEAASCRSPARSLSPGNRNLLKEFEALVATGPRLRNDDPEEEGACVDTSLDAAEGGARKEMCDITAGRLLRSPDEHHV
ncbi:hypothetical protein MRX96_016011 [Rhipicephalus microplus]